MEEEEREAQSAKLQELIRRGTPADLQEANRLMKVMAGFDTRSKTDYRAKAAEEVSKIQAKARLLEERLESFSSADNGELEELAAALQSAQPKIQKMCEEESDDHEAVARLLEINDSIHRTAERYRLLKKGDVEGAAKIAQGAPLPAGGASESGAAAGELSLIDFDADAGAGNETAPSASAPSQPGGLENDLLGLSIGDPVPTSYGQAGDIALGFGANESKLPVITERKRTKANSCSCLDIPGPALLSSVTQNNRAKAPSPAFSSFTSPPSASSSVMPQPAQSTFTPPPPQQQKPPTDPFASLIGVSPSTTPAPARSPAQAQAPAPPPAASNDDDEWVFSSALPPEVPQEYSSTICNTGLTITLNAARKHGPNALSLLFWFSNNTAQEFTELHYQLAAQKVNIGPVVFFLVAEMLTRSRATNSS